MLRRSLGELFGGAQRPSRFTGTGADSAIDRNRPAATLSQRRPERAWPAPLPLHQETGRSAFVTRTSGIAPMIATPARPIGRRRSAFAMGDPRPDSASR
jgi:hypothetical protein